MIVCNIILKLLLAGLVCVKMFGQAGNRQVGFVNPIILIGVLAAPIQGQ
jgi:hypothetical protein